MHDAPKEGTKQKKPYSKPEITQILLKPDEAVLAVCKSTTTAGSVQSACNNPGPCSTLGS